jgi:3-hydroxyacyl-CoA dehydrogenase
MDGRSVKGHGVVLGAGVMGAQIAAHLANAGWRSTLLDIVPEGAGTGARERNDFAAKGVDRALKARPAAFFLPEFKDRITLGNFEDDLKVVKDADWVLEAIIEKPDIKRRIHASIDKFAGPATVVTTNTSGLSISEMSADCSESYRKRFFGSHFFNPPRYLPLLELIPTPETDPQQILAFKEFAEAVLGKRVVIAKDTPGFIANRLGCFSMQHAINCTVKYGLTIEEADFLTGPLIGHPKSGTFRLSDLVGLDVGLLVGTNLLQRLPQNRWTEIMTSGPNIQQQLVERGALGEKSGAGYYRREADRSISSLDLTTLEYRPQQKARFGSVSDIRKAPLAERLRELVKLDDKVGQYTWETTRDIICYAAEIAEEIADDIPSVDNGIKWGYAWEVGPFQIWDILGVKETADRIEKEGLPVPPLVESLLKGGHSSFYHRSEGKTVYADLHSPSRTVPAPEKPEFIVISDLKDAGKTIKETKDASLIDIGDGVRLLEWHTEPMNILGPGVIQMIDWSREDTEKNGVALVIGNQGEHFSAGFNVGLILMSIQDEDWDEVAMGVALLQNTVLKLKRSKVPVVAATHGFTLGGGCETMLHCSAVQAAAESYIGLPEPGIGVIPGGGGTTEMALRAMNGVANNADPFPALQQAFEAIGMVKIGTSAPEAVKIGWLRKSDGITLGKDRVIYEAKQRALAMAHASYHPAQPETMLALGQDGLAKFDAGLYNMMKAGYISEHDRLIGHELASVMCAGNLIHPTVVTEEYILQIEREAFVRLCATPKTYARIKHFIETNKPLRN